jgi:hypothetical protein
VKKHLLKVVPVDKAGAAVGGGVIRSLSISTRIIQVSLHIVMLFYLFLVIVLL